MVKITQGIKSLEQHVRLGYFGLLVVISDRIMCRLLICSVFLCVSFPHLSVLSINSSSLGPWGWMAAHLGFDCLWDANCVCVCVCILSYAGCKHGH